MISNPMPKKRQLNLWQQFLKNYADTEGMVDYKCAEFLVIVCLLEGKADQLPSNAWFNKQANRLYCNLTDDNREELIVQTTTSEVMTQAEVKKKGS